MHPSSRRYMQQMFRRHAASRPCGHVLDIGAMGRRPFYRSIWEGGGWKYTGCDLVAGPNVDTVLEDPFVLPFGDESVDALISGQMLEHNEMFWLTFLEMARVLRMGGLMVHIAPSRGHEHRAPQDCWRFYRDGMTALVRWSGLAVLEATTDWETRHLETLAEISPRRRRRMEGTYRRLDTEWGDTVGVFEKSTPTAESVGMGYVHLFASRIGTGG